MIQVSHLTKRFGSGATAIHDLNFEIQPGEIVGFLGPNGAGKSTTMNIITGLTPSTEGHVKVNGYDVFENPIEVKKQIGFLPEHPPLYPEMRVEDYLKFAAQIRQVENANIKIAVDLALQKTNIAHVRHRLIGNLSKGYRQRVGIAQALVHRPQVLILDEPTVGLDPKQIIEIRELIQSLKGEHIVILSSHILPEVTAVCERIIVIHQGKIVFQGSIEEVLLQTKRGTIYYLKVREISQKAVQMIQQIEGVNSVSIEAKASRLIIGIVSDVSHIQEKIIEIAVKEGMGILEFYPEKMSFEDVFLQLTQS